ncbi:hypothetical protein C6503_26915 [Candidatus Poribacteria bacterium]|nr:MAG: hypothetical protein C6503_26915 [Candidatus Poribacteria bacterium]
MKTDTSHLADNNIGQVFTPPKWAAWLINRWGIFEAWLDGAHICDPTAGEGAFPLAMLHIARQKGVPITPERLSRLTLIEIVPSHLEQFRENVKREFGIDFPTSQIFCQDVITEVHAGKYDILIGNPPWTNFGDLPTAYKARLKPFFLEEELVPDRQKTLLGSSRTDIAALVLKVVLGRLLKKNGIGYFYIPTSLFFGEGAHNGFRDYSAKASRNGVDAHRNFAVDTVYEFTSTKVFEGIRTSYCCAKFQIDTRQNFPVSYFTELNGEWVAHKALPLQNPTDPWRVVQDLDELNMDTRLKIGLSSKQKPRQGVNTCGANSVFIFDHKPPHLPEQFLYPLATKEIWRQNTSLPRKWILLPYDRQTGKSLTWHEIEQWNTLKAHLQDAQNMLKARKGTLLRSAMKRGNWWVLLGVGAYTFAPFKVIWQAYGRSDFTPVVLGSVEGQMWQGNQAMHAFIPCWSEREAQRIKTALENPEIPMLLRQLNGAGKCNWAQPGKIKKILEFDREA